MPLTKARGNMYEWVTDNHTHLRGACDHKCHYCYVASTTAGRTGHYQGPMRLAEHEFKVNYGSGKTIFLEYMSDIGAPGVSWEWLCRIIHHAGVWPDNSYVIQTKNPLVIIDAARMLPPKNIIGTTIETNRPVRGCTAPLAGKRAWAMGVMAAYPEIAERFVTIEPIMKFDLEQMVDLIKAAQPDWVNIGADSKKHNLPEPTRGEVLALASELSNFTTIRNKDNLERLVG